MKNVNMCILTVIGVTIAGIAIMIGSGIPSLKADDSCNLADFYTNCKTGCPSGYAHNHSGCPTCECAERPQEMEMEMEDACEILECDFRCEDYLIGDNGCPTCECSDPEFIDPAGEKGNICNLAAFYRDCDLGCPQGYEHDKDGCPQCECSDVSVDAIDGCETVECKSRCEDYVLDNTGCPTCECSNPQAVDMATNNDTMCDFAGFNKSCEIGCPSGYVHDAGGCQICECVELPEESPDGCQTLTCEGRCQDYVIDRGGCPTCECGS